MKSNNRRNSVLTITRNPWQLPKVKQRKSIGKFYWRGSMVIYEPTPYGLAKLTKFAKEEGISIQKAFRIAVRQGVAKLFGKLPTN